MSDKLIVRRVLDFYSLGKVKKECLLIDKRETAPVIFQMQTNTNYSNESLHGISVPPPRDFGHQAPKGKEPANAKMDLSCRRNCQ